MNVHRWFIPAGAVLVFFLVSRVEARNQERVASETVTPQTQSPEGANTLTLPARVRLRMTDGSRLTGELLRVEEGRAIVRTDASPSGPERVISVTEVRSAEVSRGKRGQAKRGAALGLATAVASSVIYTTVINRHLCLTEEGECYNGFGGNLVIGLIYGTALGVIAAPLGAGIGALQKTDRWEDTSVSSLGASSPPVKAPTDAAESSPDRQMRFSIAPTIDRGVQARFSISWR